MRDLSNISRVLYRHSWTSPEEWALTLERLADLNDEEITALERFVIAEQTRDDRPASVSGEVIEVFTEKPGRPTVTRK